MNGAERVLEVAAAAGVSVCFANPGTTELPFVAALDEHPSIRPIPTLFEGVATGGADGYGRMAERPALTLLHLGPGLANGLANLHNARRARSPVVNLVGGHPAWLEALDPPLASDAAALARAVSGWVRTTSDAAGVGQDAAEAIEAAGGWPGRVATLIVPVDCQWGEAGPPPRPPSARPPPAIEGTRREVAREALLRRGPAALLLGGAGLRAEGLRAAARVAESTGCRLLCETFPSRMECGQGLPAPTRLPYLPEMARGALSQVRTLVIAGAEEPVPYFAETPGPCRVVPPSTAVEVLARPTEDVVGALEALADDLHARRSPAIATRPALVRPAGEALHVHAAVATIAAALPEGSIVVDEGVSAGGAFLGVAPGCPRHSYLSLTGGATGLGLPCAIGAALACPDRKVLALVGDGSALYTIQALWTQARQGVDVVTVICANDGYRILELETIRRHGRVGPAARALIDFARPPIDWLDVARGFGVPATRVGSVSELMDALNRSFAERGPHLIEMRLPRRSNDGPPGA